jgi:hypothetical protein
VRFEVQLNCRLKRWGDQEMIDATTLNLGRLGALVVTRSSSYMEALPQPGETVSLEVLLPAHQQFGQRCLACDAVAVRATKEGGRCFIALEFERLEIKKVAAAAMSAAPLGVM